MCLWCGVPSGWSTGRSRGAVTTFHHTNTGLPHHTTQAQQCNLLLKNIARRELLLISLLGQRAGADTKGVSTKTAHLRHRLIGTS